LIQGGARETTDVIEARWRTASWALW